MKNAGKGRDASLWRRLFVDRTMTTEQWMHPHPFFRIASIMGLGFAIAGWVLASSYPGLSVTVCAGLAIILGLLGVRSKLRSLGLIGFVMGMFLLPNAIWTLIRMFRS